MENYSLYEKDRKTYLKELWWRESKYFVVFAIACFVFTIFYFIVGFTVAKEALTYCLGALMYFLLSSFISFIKYWNYKNYLQYFLVSTLVNNGNHDFSLDIQEDSFHLVYLNKNQNYIFKKDEIRKIRTTKSLLLVYLLNRSMIILPNSATLLEKFK